MSSRKVTFDTSAVVCASSGMTRKVPTKTEDGLADRFNLVVTQLLERPNLRHDRNVRRSNIHLPHLKKMLSWIAQSPRRKWLCEPKTINTLFGKQHRIDYVKDLVDGITL